MAIRWALALLLLLAPAAGAACRKEWDCTKGYPCARVETCDSVFQGSPIPLSSAEQSPRVSPTPPRPASAIPRSVVPPFGTSSCAEAFICGDDGKCSWQTRCR
jgi:hypothetical protein